jgi:hypothetical protein
MTTTNSFGGSMNQIARRHFSAKTLRALTKRGVSITGLTTIPGAGDMPYANGETGYLVNDNDCGKVWTFAMVLKAAA